MEKIIRGIAGVGLLAVSIGAWADINIGVSLSATGPAASLGIPETRAIQILPKAIGAEKVNYIILDDGSDATSASRNASKLISEHHVDLIVGSTLTPTTLAMLGAAVDSGTPIVSIAASAAVTAPMDAKKKWVFKVPAGEGVMAEGIAAHMEKLGVKTLGFIGFATQYGDSWLAETRSAAAPKGIQIIAEERFNPSDTSVVAQIQKILAKRPDAILIAAVGTPGATPHLEIVRRGFKGVIYQTHGVANADFLRLGGKEVNGAYLAISPMMVASQLPADDGMMTEARKFISLYESSYGQRSANIFAANVWDFFLILQQAVPAALKSGKPGTAQFRAALRDAIEGTKNVVGACAVYSMTPSDHNGVDSRARTMVQIKDGSWQIVK